MEIKLIPCEYESQAYSAELIECYNDQGQMISHGGFRTRKSIYCGKLIDTMAVSGLATPPQFRRAGAVRAMMNKMFEIAPERGWAVSFLHPFSFSYYRKFGYEKVADHKVIRFPIAKLDFVDRCPDFVPVNSVKTAEDAVRVYNEFTLSRNIMFPRYGTYHFPTDGNSGNERTYLRYDGNTPVAYVKLSQNQFFDVNKMTSIALNVHEIAFTTPQSLRDVFGFLRMFEGEDNTVVIENAAMSPEIDTVLKHYMHTEYKLIPDLAGRIFDVKTVLEANRYPEGHGGFTVNVVDTLPYTNGTYSVEYQDGVAEARRIDACDADVIAPMPAFTQLMYGYDEYDPFRASFLDGVEINNAESDFFKVFHKKSCGLFEHF